MRELFLTGLVILLLGWPSFAQYAEPVPAPAEVILNFSTENDQHQFHLGELIPVKFSYSTATPGKYMWVSLNNKLTAGHGLEITCSPSAEPVRRSPLIGPDDRFERMLNSCGGVGGGFGGGCGDCDREYPLSATALTFGTGPLNTYVRFRTPGTYTCEASSADITTAPRDENIRPALRVKSNPVLLTIADDPSWAHFVVLEYASAYEKLCRGDDVAQQRFLQCADVARRITYLDTADSLATEVRWFDGRNHGWENGFWEAIQHSSQPEQALTLMAARMQQPDFEVSTSILEWLASSELWMEVPDASQTGTPATYHAQAIEKLRKYTRLLGSSLFQKDPKVLSESRKTYRSFAEQKYCEPQSLISREEQNRLAGASIRQ
jgi:hypothetical protein